MLNGLNSAGNVFVICGNAASVEFQWKFNIGAEQSELAETSGRFRTRALRAGSRDIIRLVLVLAMKFSWEYGTSRFYSAR